MLRVSVLVMSSLDLFISRKGTYSSKKNDKIAAKIKECFSIALARADFPIFVKGEEVKMPCPITVTYVDLSPDLRNAKVFVMPLGGKCQNETIRFLEKQTHFFKETIASKMKMKFIPNITFFIDDSFGYSEKIENLLKKIK